MQVTPRGDRVLIEIDYKTEQVRDSGLVIPEATKASPQQGRVLAVGDGLPHPVTGELVPVKLNVGDVVIYSRHAGTPIEQDGIIDERAPKLSIFRDLDIIAVVS